jgi:hypothetical protein
MYSLSLENLSPAYIFTYNAIPIMPFHFLMNIIPSVNEISLALDATTSHVPLEQVILLLAVEGLMEASLGLPYHCSKLAQGYLLPHQICRPRYVRAMLLKVTLRHSVTGHWGAIH